MLQETSCAVVRGSNKTARTEWRAKWWVWKSRKNVSSTYFSLEPMLSGCVCVHVFVQRSLGGLLSKSPSSALAVMWRKADDSSSLSLHSGGGVTEHFLISQLKWSVCVCVKILVWRVFKDHFTSLSVFIITSLKFQFLSSQIYSLIPLSLNPFSLTEKHLQPQL